MKSDEPTSLFSALGSLFAAHEKLFLAGYADFIAGYNAGDPDARAAAAAVGSPEECTRAKEAYAAEIGGYDEVTVSCLLRAYDQILSTLEWLATCREYRSAD